MGLLLSEVSVPRRPRPPPAPLRRGLFFEVSVPRGFCPSLIYDMLLVRSTPDSFSPTSAGRPLAFRFIGFGCDVRCCLGGCSPSLFDLFIMSLRVCSDATTSFGAVVAEGTHDTKPAGLLTGQVSRVPLSQHLLPRHSTLIFVKLDRPTDLFCSAGSKDRVASRLCVEPKRRVRPFSTASATASRASSSRNINNFNATLATSGATSSSSPTLLSLR